MGSGWADEGMLTVARAKTINDSSEHVSTSRPSCSLMGKRIVDEGPLGPSLMSEVSEVGRHAVGSSFSALTFLDHAWGEGLGCGFRGRKSSGKQSK